MEVVMDRAFSIIFEQTADGALMACAGAVEIVRQTGEWRGQHAELHTISIDVRVLVIDPGKAPVARLELGEHRK
jgi:hypothetical protein